MKILIRHSPEDVATTAAQIFAQHITPGARIGLATGSTPLLMYQELIRKFQRGDLTFAQVDAFCWMNTWVCRRNIGSLTTPLSAASSLNILILRILPFTRRTARILTRVRRLGSIKSL